MPNLLTRRLLHLHQLQRPHLPWLRLPLRPSRRPKVLPHPPLLLRHRLLKAPLLRPRRHLLLMQRLPPQRLQVTAMR